MNEQGCYLGYYFEVPTPKALISTIQETSASLYPLEPSSAETIEKSRNFTSPLTVFSNHRS